MTRRARVLVVVGTRPEAIKMAPVVSALRSPSRSARLETRLVLTGQHTTLVDQVLTAFDLDPQYDLGIMKPGQTLYDVAQGCLDGLGSVLRDFEPDLVLVQGDTATVFFASLAAFFERTRVGHVEAGLRSGDKWAPYPEEIFRRLTDQLTDLYFAPTDRARANLLAEGTSADQVFVTGNTVVDALLRVRDRAPEVTDTATRDALESGGRLALLTAHRRESFGAPLVALFGAVAQLVEETPDLNVIYPVHPNPNVLEPARELLGPLERVHLVEPLGYFDLVHVLSRADLVLTDSGGIQEEAPTFGTPVLVLREVTERPEGVDAGVATLVGTDPQRILEAARAALAQAPGVAREPGPNPYGDGRAGERIAQIVDHSLTGEARTLSDFGS